MNPVFSKRFEALKTENQKIGVLYELYRLREDFQTQIEYHPALLDFVALLLDSKIEFNGLKEMQMRIRENPEVVSEIKHSILRGVRDFKNLDKSIDSELSAYVFMAPLLPLLRKTAQSVKTEAKGKSCPVCGEPFVLSAYKDKKRYLLCKLCGARYHVDLFWCPKCGNRDAGKLGFIFLEEEPEFRIDYCFLCSTYIKAADEDRIGTVDDPLLFDIATLDLDAVARERGLKSTDSF